MTTAATVAINNSCDDTCNNIYKKSATFCRELKRLRIKNNLTQKALATALTVEDSSVRNWEHGRTFPHDSTCKQIVEILHLTAEELPLLFVIEERPNNIAEISYGTVSAAVGKVSVSEETEEVVSEALPEEATSKSAKPKKTKPLTTIFKEMWLKIRKPFVIGVAVWIVEWILIVAVSAIGYHYSTSGAKYSNYQREILIFDGAEFALLLGLSFIATVVIFTLIYIFKRRKQTQ